MTDSRTYAIVGCGMMGREHMRNLALVPEAELVAIVDPHGPSRDAAAELAGKLGQSFACYETVEDMMPSARPDAVIVAAPNHTHFAIAQQLMGHEVALLLEKPMCTTVEDAGKLAALAADYDPLFWVGLEYRYMPPVTRFVERVQAGETGPVRMLSIREHRFPFLTKVGDWNRFSANTGGTLVEKCCHFFDLMRHILQDEPVRIFASGGQDVNHLDEVYDGKPSDILDNAYVIVDFAGGARATLDLCMFAEGAEQQEEIYALGDVGKLDVRIPAAEIIWSPRDGAGVRSEPVDTPPEALAAGDHHGATWFQLLRFHKALVEGGSPDVSAIDGLRSVEMGAAAHQSIETGLPVALDFSG
ncbi:Predicted dehydrogenase [Parasphingorhabdus marina DSM 22363]|uniref:Predicted dehydrogenase n=1 Tax=Parasphingorhabdus marina DSM 22363 TaxID=1123272 RepID=A0A1N6CXQ8_9SPHN|nr:Gfo/Idh/MocA family oxidoreductase [Parasphingorhabdus marina]SIN63302.1 Predicted dehydrogenase [Parasphingorhabdus marina DSM 22363]